jgi:hypothetical protein
VHADPAKPHAGQAGWILTAKMVFFVTSGFVRFVGESRPARWIEPVEISRQYPFPLSGTFGRVLCDPLTGTMSYTG